MFIKICANTNVEDARLAAELGADAVGFVFAPSRRQVTAEEVADFVPQLPKRIEKVGVFATDDPFEVEHVVACAGLTAAQLHGPFRREMVTTLAEEFGGALKIIQTVAYEVNPADRADADARFEAALRLVFTEPGVWAVLLDAAKSGASGGLGVAFDWEHVAAIVRRTQAAFGSAAPWVILAGGLRAENVSESIAAMQPWGVDVASGVEAEMGRKDPEKLRAFVKAAREMLKR